MTALAMLFAMPFPPPSTVPCACIKDNHGHAIIIRAPNAATCDRLRGITLETVE